MTWLATLALDFVLVFTLLFSVHCASCWGELCGISPGRDKSGLAGFGSAIMLFLVRWLGLAIALVAVARDGEVGWLLGAHALLGWLSYTLFERCLRDVQNDRYANAGIGIAAGVLLPLPALVLTIGRANPGWLGDAPATLAILAFVIAIPHWLCFARHRASMLRASPP